MSEKMYLPFPLNEWFWVIVFPYTVWRHCSLFAVMCCCWRQICFQCNYHSIVAGVFFLSGSFEILSSSGWRFTLTSLGANLLVFILPGTCSTFSSRGFTSFFNSQWYSHKPSVSLPFPLVSPYGMPLKWEPLLFMFKNIFSLCNMISVNSLAPSSRSLMVS